MRIVFKKVIEAGAGKGPQNVTLYHELTSISAPQSGMSFVDGNWWTKVTHVEYDAGKQTFICNTEPNREIHIAMLEGYTADPIDRIIKRYLEKGWTSKVLV